MAEEARCACGKPLHYESPTSEELVVRMIELAGSQFVRVEGLQGVYRVQRHYIALHGLIAADLEDLVRKGFIQKLEVSDGPGESAETP